MTYCAVTVLVKMHEGEEESEVLGRLGIEGTVASSTLGEEVDPQAIEAAFTKLAAEQAQSYQSGPGYASGE